MHADTDFRAILAVDCGIEHTRVALVDIVGENEYRLVAQRELATTAEPPYANVTLAVQQAIVELERGTGRQLLENDRLKIPQGRDGQGVDAFVATCSAGGSIPVLVLAITADITAQSAVRAVEGTFAVPFQVVTMDQVLREAPLNSSSDENAPEPWWKAVGRLYPGGVLLVGGVEGGNVAPLRTLARSLAEAVAPAPTRLEQEVARPPLPVIYAGNSRAQETVQQYLTGQLELHTVENVRPSLREENLLPARQEIERLYEEQVLKQLPGYEELASWAQSPVQLPYMGLQLVARFLSMHHQRQVLALDVGSGSTAMAWAGGEQCRRVVLGHMGTGYGIARVLARRGVEGISRWLPFPVSAEEIRDWILNQALYPRTVPVTVRDVLIQQAVAREAVVAAMEKLSAQAAGPCEMLVASGGAIGRAPRLPQSVLMLLDALQPDGRNPSGLVDLYLDRSCLIPSIGAMATLNPDAAACVLLRDGLMHLGPCLVPLGRFKAGARALQVEIEYADGVTHGAEVRWGQVEIVAFRFGQEAHLTVNPSRGVFVGHGRPGEQLTTREGEMIRSGALGLIIDARGRPLPLPEDEELRRSTVRGWLEQINAYTKEELDGVMPPPPEPPAEAAEEAAEEPVAEEAPSDGKGEA